jgi:hypothetical protein
MLKRFINDGFGSWLPPTEFSHKEENDKWTGFKAGVNNDHELE